MLPKISVVIPVYNVEKYLQACIDSLLNQTMEDIEYIFVNDVSPDNCIQILEKNKKTYPDKIRIIDMRENLCQGGARNAGIRAARAEYIGFVDSDDMVMPNMYETLYSRMQETNADVVFLQYTRCEEGFGLTNLSEISQMENAEPIYLWNKRLIDLNNKILDDKDRMHLMSYQIGGVVCGLWKKELIEKANVYFPEKLKYEDNYWVSLIKCYINKVSFIEQIGYIYRKNPTSTVRSRNASYQFDRIKIEAMLLEDAKKRKVFDTYYDAWEYMYTFRYVFNSFFIYMFRFDDPSVDIMLKLIADLKENFPDWSKNPYYKELIPMRRKIKYKLIVKYPKLMIKIYPYIHRFIKGK